MFRASRVLPNRVSGFALLGVAFFASPAVAAPPSFVVTFDPAVRKEPYTGRVYVFTVKDGEEPRRGPDWFNPAPFFAKDVEDWKPGEPLKFSADDPDLLAFPKPLGELDLDGSKAQAVARFNPWEREVGVGPGNGYGTPVKIGDAYGPFRLTINRLVEAKPYEETKWG